MSSVLSRNHKSKCKTNSTYFHPSMYTMASLKVLRFLKSYCCCVAGTCIVDVWLLHAFNTVADISQYFAQIFSVSSQMQCLLDDFLGTGDVIDLSIFLCSHHHHPAIGLHRPAKSLHLGLGSVAIIRMAQSIHSLSFLLSLALSLSHTHTGIY